ncbi:PREDICTED: TMV resistance protein N-like [Fragaria vesca subsp. vesca]|uniref:TMV resistance protein N-like n=1 Tax=Fragaria vesca subsp. vesca TaxID=101020 RepID=UPI0002C35F1A|nr:PREDICTED: TMV resistance protein N-like [Fragaria vesca subsp. vesca]
MDRLQLLKIGNVKFCGNINSLSRELQFLQWHDCPFDSFPSDFAPAKLVELHLHSSRIIHLWRGEKGWSMLRQINLSGTQHLISTPDFSEVPDFEMLVLQDCTSLVDIHPSLGFLKKLHQLNMRNCMSVESLPSFNRNWDWSVEPPFGCFFYGNEISKGKWFQNFNEGSTAEIQLPLNLFDNATWLGIAVCAF